MHRCFNFVFVFIVSISQVYGNEPGIRVARQGLTIGVGQPNAEQGALAQQFLGGLAGAFFGNQGNNVANALINLHSQHNSGSRPGFAPHGHNRPMFGQNNPGRPNQQPPSQQPPFNQPSRPNQPNPVQPQTIPPRPPLQPQQTSAPVQPRPTQPPVPIVPVTSATTVAPLKTVAPTGPKSPGELKLEGLLSQCGAPKVTTNRISGGVESPKGAWPWMAALRYVDQDDNVETFCGGSLITRKRVLTAAHCLPGPAGYDLLKVRLGDHNLADGDDDSDVVERFVAKWVQYEDYDEKTSKNDVALLILDRDIDFTDFVLPICMPLTPPTRTNQYVNSVAYIAGWGYTDFGKTPSNSLQEAKIRVVPETQCKSSYNGIRDTIIDNTVVCAGVPSGKQDACQGDSGGPLMAPVQGKYYLIGIISKGVACNTPGIPGIYTRVTSFLEWIMNNIN